MLIDRESVEHRMGYHKMTTQEQIQVCSELRAQFIDLGETLTILLPEGRCASISMTELESSLMWAIKAIALEAPLDLGN